MNEGITEITDMLFLLGGIIATAGLIMHIFPPKNANYIYGYRTPRSMKDEASWKFSQRYSAKWMLVVGGGYLLIGGFIYFLELDPIFNFTTWLIICIVCVFIPIFLTERALKRRI